MLAHGFGGAASDVDLLAVSNMVETVTQDSKSGRAQTHLSQGPLSGRKKPVIMTSIMPLSTLDLNASYLWAQMMGNYF